MTALQHMVAILLRSEKWLPDRATAAQIRRCSACATWKPAESFSPTDHLCRGCRKLLSRANRKRNWSGRWRA
jgi:hypothetical protein